MYEFLSLDDHNVPYVSKRLSIDDDVEFIFVTLSSPITSHFIFKFNLKIKSNLIN